MTNHRSHLSGCVLFVSEYENYRDSSGITGLVPRLLSTQTVTAKLTFSLLVTTTVLASACGGDDARESGGLDGDGSGVIFGDEQGGTDGEGLDDGIGDAGGDDAIGAADDGGGGPECTHERFEVGAEPPSVMLVLDKSSSMSDERWVHNGELVTRWASLHGVVSDLVGAYDSTINFGATLFPAAGSGHWGEGFAAACGVDGEPDVEARPDSSAAILEAIPGPEVAVQGATPASAGMLTALQSLALGGAEQRAVLLVTDGLANCADEGEMFLYDGALPLVTGAAYEELGIPTYVVGIDIRDELVDYAQANAHEALDEVARVGGVPRSGEVGYYAASDEDSLYGALDEIAARIECTIALGQPVADDAALEVRVGDKPVEQVADCSQDGWRFTDDQRSTIELCGLACDGLRVEGALETQICEDGEVLPVP